MRSFSGAIAAVAFSSDGQQIASAGADGAVRVWRRPVAPQILEGHTQAVAAVAVSPDGARLALVGSRLLQ